MSIIEAAGRGGAIALLLLLAAVALRDGRRVAAARFASLFAAGVAAALVCFAPPLVLDHALWLVPLRGLAFGNPAVFWVLAAALFSDAFSLTWRHVAAWCALVGSGFWAVYGDHSSHPFGFSNALSLICLSLAIWPVIAGRADDLVEARRRMRSVFVVSVGVFIASIIIVVTVLRGQTPPLFGNVNALGSCLMALTFCFALLGLRPATMVMPLPSPATGPVKKSRNTVLPAVCDDPRERQLMTALQRELEEKRAYREEALGIAALASRLGVPEYRLRRLINRRLGFRNFSTFLNSYRISEAMTWLADPAQADVPILTLGLDAGFQSIGSFNRAFKETTGITPSEFRRRELVAAALPRDGEFKPDTQAPHSKLD